MSHRIQPGSANQTQPKLAAQPNSSGAMPKGKVVSSTPTLNSTIPPILGIGKQNPSCNSTTSHPLNGRASSNSIPANRMLANLQAGVVSSNAQQKPPNDKQTLNSINNRPTAPTSQHPILSGLPQPPQLFSGQSNQSQPNNTHVSTPQGLSGQHIKVGSQAQLGQQKLAGLPQQHKS